jgi:vacuolar-type H+-ATPase subunit H
VLNNLQGRIKVKDGIASLENVNFSSLDGQFGMNGFYNTQNPQLPTFDFNLNIRDLSIARAYESFNTVQAMAPIAEKVNGKFSTEFKINGRIGNDMMPVLPTLTGAGIIKIAQASLKDSNIIGGVTKLTKLANSDQVTMKDVIMQAEIKEGRLHVQPFDVNIGNYRTTIQGSNGMDGSLDYNLKMDIPAGAAGAALNNALASLSGRAASGSSNIKLNMKVGGTYEDPKFGLAGSEAGESVQQQTKAAVEERIDKEVDKAKEEFDARKKEAEEKAREEVEQKREEIEEKAKEEVEKAKEQTKEKAKDKVRDLLKKN